MFWQRAKRLEQISPLEKCTNCYCNVLITVEAEPISGDYFRNNSVQKCIVKCSNCGVNFISNYDS